MTGFGDALIEKGIQKGRKEEKDALIWNMYIKNFSIAQIADITNDSIDYIKEVLSTKSKESLNQYKHFPPPFTAIAITLHRKN